jgi:ABC-2 type transport system permease protein
VHQWFEQVTLPRFELSSLGIEALPGGKWRVSGKLRNAGTGDVSVDVAAVSGEQNRREQRANVITRAGVVVDFVLETDFAPERLVVDPDVMVLQVGRKGAAGKL